MKPVVISDVYRIIPLVLFVPLNVNVGRITVTTIPFFRLSRSVALLKGKRRRRKVIKKYIFISTAIGVTRRCWMVFRLPNGKEEERNKINK